MRMARVMARNDAAPADQVDVTFQVDLNDYSGAYGTVNLNGSFNGWCGACAAMTDVNADGVYDLTISLAPGTYEYKFTLMVDCTRGVHRRRSMYIHH